MLDKLQKVEEHFGEVESRLGDPSVITNVEKFTALETTLEEYTAANAKELYKIS